MHFHCMLQSAESFSARYKEPEYMEECGLRYSVYHACQTCRQPWTGEAKLLLSEALYAHVQDLPSSPSELYPTMNPVVHTEYVITGSRAYADALGDMETGGSPLHARHGGINFIGDLQEGRRPPGCVRAVAICGNLLGKARQLKGLHGGQYAGLADEHCIDINLTLGTVLRALGALDAARLVAAQNYAAAAVVLGPDDVETLKIGNNLGNVLSQQGKVRESVALFRDLLARKERVHGPDDMDTAMTAVNLAAALRKHAHTGQPAAFAEAIRHYTHAMQVATQTLGPRHPTTVAFGQEMRKAQAESRAWGVGASTGTLDPGNPPYHAYTRTRLCMANEEYEEAEQVAREAFARLRSARGLTDPETWDTGSILCDAVVLWDAQGAGRVSAWKKAEAMQLGKELMLCTPPEGLLCRHPIRTSAMLRGYQRENAAGGES